MNFIITIIIHRKSWAHYCLFDLITPYKSQKITKGRKILQSKVLQKLLQLLKYMIKIQRYNS